MTTSDPSQEAMEWAMEFAPPCKSCNGTGVISAPGLSPEDCDDCDGYGVVAKMSIARAIDAAVAEATTWPAEEDQPLLEDEAIRAAHPTRTGDHARYAEAMRLVGARRSKYGLVDLVNWLLPRSPGGGERSAIEIAVAEAVAKERAEERERCARIADATAERCLGEARLVRDTQLEYRWDWARTAASEIARAIREGAKP